MKCKTVILRKTNVVKIPLKKCKLFFPYFVRRGIHNCRLKDLENLDLTCLIFPPDYEIDRKGPDRKIDQLTGTLSSFCQTTADLLIEHRKLTLVVRPWKVVSPQVIEPLSAVTQFSWDCTAAAVSYGTGTPSTIFLGFHINFRVKPAPFLSNYNVFTGLNQFPFFFLQGFYRVKTVSLYRFTRILQVQTSLPFSIYKVLQCQCERFTGYLQRRYCKYVENILHVFTWSPIHLLPKDAGCECFFFFYGKFTWWGKTGNWWKFILQTLSCRLEFTKHVNCILQGVISFIHVL